MAASRTPIPSSPSQRLGTLRRRFLPAAVWLAAVVAVVILYQRQGGHIAAPGIVERYEVAVGPLEDGILQALSVELLREVQAGEILGVLDGTLVEAELRVAQADLTRLRAEVEAGRTALEQTNDLQARDAQGEYRRFLIDAEEARLDLLLLTVEQETGRIELERLEVLRDSRYEEARQDVADILAYDEARLSFEAARTRLEENEAALAFCEQRVEETARRVAQYADREMDEDLAALLAPLREAIAVQDARIQAVEARRNRLVLRAPVSGIISKVFHRAGDPVLAGQIVAAITVPHASRVVAYLPEGQTRDVKAGMAVEVYSRQQPSEVAMAEVIRVGKSIEELPLHLRRSQAVTQWGLPVLVGHLPEERFHPGEAVHVRFLR